MICLELQKLAAAFHVGCKAKKYSCSHKLRSFTMKKSITYFSTENRKNIFKRFWKDLMGNSICGRAMANERSRIVKRLMNNSKDCSKLVTKLNSKIKEVLSLNKPAYFRMCILDLSKTLVYDFHSCYIRNKYVDKPKLWLTDTDSWAYEF